MIRSFRGKTPKIAASAVVDETSILIGDVEIGEESSIWPGAVIRGDMGKITIGKQSIVEDNCVIHSGAPGVKTEDVDALRKSNSGGLNMLMKNTKTLLEACDEQRTIGKP